MIVPFIHEKSKKSVISLVLAREGGLGNMVLKPPLLYLNLSHDHDNVSMSVMFEFSTV